MAARKNVRVAAREAMQRFNYDPLEVLILHAQSPDTKEDVKMEVATILLPYMYPRLSNMAVEADITTNTTTQSHASMLRRFLEDPELADAAQKLSVAASLAAIEGDLDGGLLN